MKRIFPLMLAALVLMPLLTACANAQPNSVSFYYCRDPEQYQYFEPDAVIQKERREVVEHRNDLKYMLSLYLAGPLTENFVRPFTKSTKLLSVEKQGTALQIELSDHTAAMNDAQFSLSCAALTLTCTEITNCTYVTVISGERTVTMDRDSILLLDASPNEETTGG